MDSIQITGEDASKIALALIADKFQGQQQFQVEALQAQWAQLGLRLDDLVQGLTFLTREQQLHIDGSASGSSLILSPATLEEIKEPGQGLAGLSKPLQTILSKAAERRKPSDSAGTTGKERRDGFI